MRSRRLGNDESEEAQAEAGESGDQVNPSPAQAGVAEDQDESEVEGPDAKKQRVAQTI